MSIVIQSSNAPVAVQGVTADIVLQPGTVINAQVKQVLGNDQVQISIGGQSIQVASQVPLQAGQSLQLAVSQGTDGSVRLAIVNQPSGIAANSAVADVATANLIEDLVTLAPSAVTNASQTSSTTAIQGQLTPQQALAVSSAAQLAATQQTSLAPLFANLDAATVLSGLPPQVQQAAALVLAQRTSLDTNLTGNNIQQAFQGSGLFLESSLASGSFAASSTPDLKAALIVLRQVLTTSLQAASASSTASTIASSTAQPVILIEQGAEQPTQISPSALTITAEPGSETIASPALAPGLAAGAATATEATPAIPPSVLEFSAINAVLGAATTPTDAAARAAASSAALNLLQEVVQGNPLAGSLVPGDNLTLSLLPAVAGARPQNIDGAVSRNALPPPPLAGALPAAQPVMPSSLSSNASPEAAMHRLLEDTDGAMARQTLLQIASLPDQTSTAATRIDAVMPRWNFEIPFVTPQGTAMAQFEISRDGATADKDAKRTWRARFSLDVEPAGPVHALVSLSGDRTSVRMWAERPATAEQMRAGVTQLSQALSRAELTPSDIVIRDGAPVQPAAARAGHFLDRAS